MVTIRDEHLEAQIDGERLHRGDATMAKTLGDLARERLRELEIARRDGARDESRLADDGAPHSPAEHKSSANHHISSPAA